MKAIVQDSYGSPDVLEFGDIDKPVAGDDDVLLRVHAAGVDPSVWHLMRGLPYAVRLVSGLRTPKARVKGADVAGRVEAVGRNVTRFKPGDEVFGTCDGSFAEYACTRADKVELKPANLSFEQAAAVPISASTALLAVRDSGRVQPGQKVLVIGAAGGVGAFAVQLAKAFGAHVTGVCSTAKVDLVRSIGADDVIDYTRDEFAANGRRYDLILDIAGSRSLSHLRRALTAKGTLVIVGGEGGGQWVGMGRQFRALLLSPFIGERLTMLVAMKPEKDLPVLRELIEAGKVTPVIDRTFSLGDAAEAVRYLEKGHAAGKIVITVGAGH